MYRNAIWVVGIICWVFASACETKSVSGKNQATANEPAATKKGAESEKAAAAKKPESKGAPPASGESANPATAKAEAPKAEADAAPAIPADSPLLNPDKATEKAPEKYTVKFDTTKGDVHIEVTRKWAPNGADRFYNLVKIGYFKDIAFFRTIGGFMVQFGIHGTPAVNAKWKEAKIKDDARGQSNKRGFVTFATAGPNTRTSQIFVNYADKNAFLDGQGFTPFGKITKGMDVIDSLYQGYGEGAPRGKGPSQGQMQSEGNAYLKKDFPLLDYLKEATLVK
jgi:peptidyl-prolyl cis-trans isomerase A (cyclophilin A)